MKKLILLLAIIGVISLPVFSVNFTLKYGSTCLSKYVYVYQNGKQVAYGCTSSSTGSLSITLPAGNYSYKTETNFTGDISATSTVTLEHKKATFTIKNNAGNPISSEHIYIYEDGIQVDNGYTNSSGIAEFYLKPSKKYAYATSFNRSAMSLLNDAAITLTKNNVSVIAKYLNYPVEDNFTLYPYGDTQNAIASYVYSSATNGEISFNVTTGNYWLKNKLNIYTKLNVTSTSQQFYLDYKKVRFISNVNEPNILENVIVSNGTYSTDTKITDGKGYADFYLLPGTYKYFHLGMSEPFTVTNDTTINLTTQTVTFNLRNGTTSVPYANQTFKIGKDMNSLSSYISNSSGTCQVKLKAGSYIFSDGISSYPFTVSTGGQIVTPPLYDVTFNITQNLPNATLTYLYVSSINTGKEVLYSTYTDGMKLCLLSGNYKFRCYGDGFSAIQSVPFQVSQNTTVQGLYAFQLNVTDNNSVGVSGQSYYIKQDGSYINTSFTTNNQGSAIAYLPNGSYLLYNTKTQEETPFTINNQNITLNLNLPNEITLNVTKDGQALTSGYVYIYNEQKTYVQSVQIANGTGKARLQSGSNYYMQLSASGIASMQSKVTVTGSSITLDFISLQIKTEGNGIAFPYSNLIDETVSIYTLKQSIVRLAAVPMKGWTCAKWIINGTNINGDFIDYTLNSATVATVVFEQNSGSGVSQTKASNNNLSIYPNPAETQINFSENLSGNAVIYNTDGKVMKHIYVYGNGINISDLSSGVYVVVVETEDGTFIGNFIKER